jgi:hypothetical protein
LSFSKKESREIKSNKQTNVISDGKAYQVTSDAGKCTGWNGRRSGGEMENSPSPTLVLCLNIIGIVQTSDRILN